MINWQQFGLKSNPYDIHPLIEGGELPLEKAFIGRTYELETLNNIILSDSRACITILGSVGVGKTSLANFLKYHFKYKENTLPLFSFRREIEASESLLDKRMFILEVMGSVLREIKLLDPTLIDRNHFLKKLEKLIDITQSLGISAGVNLGIVGIDFSESTIEYPSTIPTTTLEGYFSDLVQFIIDTPIAKKKYKGLIIHTNNFDVLLKNKEQKKKVLKFFQEMRDLLQTRHTYFLFLGPRTFFREIISTEKRIKSIFHLSPLVLEPLTKQEVKEAFEERMEILTSDDVAAYIPPFSDEVIFKLYDLYNGDVRSIMNGLKTILNQVSDTIAKPLSMNEALLLLGKERWESLKLTNEQKEVLKYIARIDKYVTITQASRELKKAPSNLSRYYFSPLHDEGIIEIIKQEGNLKYWRLTQEYIPIRFILESKTKVQEDTMKDLQQLTLGF